MRLVPSDIQRPDYADHPSGRPSFAFSLLSRLHFSIKIDEQELNTCRAAASRVTLSQELHQIMSASPSETCAEKLMSDSWQKAKTTVHATSSVPGREPSGKQEQHLVKLFNESSNLYLFIGFLPPTGRR